MQHAIRYEGGFERNFASLRAGTADFEGDDGARHAVPPWPANVDGLRFSFMERQGKRFGAVRVQYGRTVVVLSHDVPIDSARHLGGRHLAPEPLILTDASAGVLLGDIIDASPGERSALVALRDQVRHSLGNQRPHDDRADQSRA